MCDYGYYGIERESQVSVCGIGESYAKLLSVNGANPDLVVGQRIAEMRQRRGLRQDDLLDLLAARGLGWTRTVLSRVESGQRALKATELFVISDALGLSTDALNPESGRLPYAIQRQRARWKSADKEADKQVRLANEAHDGLVALLLAAEIANGNRSFIVHGTPRTFMLALINALSPDDERYSDDAAREAKHYAAHRLLGLNQARYRELVQQESKTQDSGGHPAAEPPPHFLAVPYRVLFAEQFPELSFEGDESSPRLCVPGLDMGMFGDGG